MQVFENIYHGVIRFSRRNDAPYYLSLLSFVESFILPFPPPDVMLAPMAVARPALALRFAALTLFFSVLGGLVGYLIGAFLFDLAQPLIAEWGYQARFETVMDWFEQWGFWAVLVAGFSPVPYKIFTIAAGVLNLAIVPFVLASIIGRGARFFLLAWCLAKFGPAIETRLIKYIEFIGWAIVVALLLAIVIYYM
ncbi:MAG: DedA family protein [Gammaproteobacteria bacterium]|nr:MAG: DedA family protein [Gammaproteobacteria bacterium]UCH40997.1 MAG: DedA family protein [Gammaproteobacteria bacterium]